MVPPYTLTEITEQSQFCNVATDHRLLFRHPAYLAVFQLVSLVLGVAVGDGDAILHLTQELGGCLSPYPVVQEQLGVRVAVDYIYLYLIDVEKLQEQSDFSLRYIELEGMKIYIKFVPKTVEK